MSCTVSPNPVAWGNTVTFNGSGFQANHALWAELAIDGVAISQLQESTDASGNLTFDWSLSDPSGPARSGPSSITISKAKDEKGVLCVADFTIT